MTAARILPALAMMVSYGATGETLTVSQPQTIQSAISRAKTGDTIRILPGVYKETLYIDKDGIRLSGNIEEGRWPILDGENRRSDGVLVSGHNVTVENLYVRRYLGNGIMTQGANNFSIVHNRVEGPSFYGIFPQYGQNGLVAHNVVWGIHGTGVYVGMSRNLDVVHNEAKDNAGFGIEVENSEHVLIENNYIHGNTQGVVLNLIPGLPLKSEHDILVRDNFIIRNGIPAVPASSAPHGAAPPNAPAIDSGTGEAPEGSGLLINAADASTVEGNLFDSNGGAAIMVIDHNFGQMFPFPDPKVDPVPDDNQILRNLFVSNGEQPVGRTLRLVQLFKKAKAPDLLVGGQGRRNCVLARAEIRTLGAEEWSDCPPGTTSSSVKTMILEHPVPTPSLTLQQKGRLTYLAVCTGCHAFDTRISGPPMVAARAPYTGNPQRLADWIANPTKRRADYPAMPPQSYLPPEVRLEVAKYVLGLNEP